MTDHRDPATSHPWPDASASIEDEAAALVAVWGQSRHAVPAKVSAMQLQALLIIESQTTTDLGTLAAGLAALPSSTSRLCDRLEAVGWVRRAATSTDARKLALALTPSGHALLATLRERRAADLARVLEEMPATARAALAYGLREFAMAADRIMDRRSTDPAATWPAIAARLIA